MLLCRQTPPRKIPASALPPSANKSLLQPEQEQIITWWSINKHIQNQDNPSLTLTIKNKTKFFIKRDKEDKRVVITPTITERFHFNRTMVTLLRSCIIRQIMIIFRQHLNRKILLGGTLLQPWPNAFGMRKYFSGNYVFPSPKSSKDQKKKVIIAISD